MTSTEKALREALNCMLTYMGMDEDEWNKPVFDQARAALSLPETQGGPVAKVTDAPDPAPESVGEPAAEESEQIIGSDGKAFPLTFDAQAWAKSFNKTLTALGHQQHDEGWLIGWFANAIMRGFDEAQNRAAPSSQPARSLLWSSEGYNGAIRVAADACAYLAENERPIEGEQRYNSEHLHQISEELKRTIAMLAAAPAAPTTHTDHPSRHWDRTCPACVAKPTNGEGA